jgi:putative selenium metabolism hydrolase
MIEAAMQMDTDVVDTLSELIRQPSVSGEEGKAIGAAEGVMRRLGFEDVRRDAAGSLVGAMHGEKPGQTLLFDAHIDVVAVTTPEAWQRPPFGGVQAGGRVWGRGACDNKGSLAAMLTGLAGIQKSRLAGNIYVTASVGEEQIEGAALGALLEEIRPAAVVIGEPTECRLAFGQRGRVRVVFRSLGRAGHSSSGGADNAIYSMARVAARLEKHVFPSDPHLGTGLHAPIAMVSDPYPSASTLPDKVSLTVDRRLVMGETAESILADYRRAIADLPDTVVEIENVYYSTYTGTQFAWPDFHPAWVTPPEGAFIRAAAQALTQAGLAVDAYCVEYCTNGSASAGVYGLPTLIYGPGSIEQAHAVDEYLEVAQLEQAVRGYKAIAEAWQAAE